MPERRERWRRGDLGQNLSMPRSTVAFDDPVAAVGGRLASSRRWWPFVVLLAMAVLAGCSNSSDDAEPGATNTAPSATDLGQGSEGTDETPAGERTGIDGDFGEVAVTITAADGETCELCLLLADTTELRSQGLMRVTDPDLGGYDGMLFDHGGTSAGGYWMKNTPMPLSIAYWSDEGRFVSSVDMEPCVDEPDGGCPSYGADAPYRYALEVTQGGLDEVLAVEGATLSVDGTTCPPIDL